MNEKDLETDYYGCFGCLTVGGNVIRDPNGHVYCAECGDDSLMTLSKALEILGQAYTDGRLYPHDVNGDDVLYDETEDDPQEGSLNESYEDDYDEEK